MRTLAQGERECALAVNRRGAISFHDVDHGDGRSAEQGKQLALSTFAGATALAQASSEPPDVLRERVTSKGGTTYAALQSLEKDGVGASFERAMHAAEQRAHALGNEFGA